MRRHSFFAALFWFAPLIHGQVVAPFIGIVTPSEVDVGGPGFDLTVDGYGFVQGSVVNWSGAPLATTFRRADRLIASVPSSLLVNANPFNITVTNPDGDASSPFVFKVQPILTGITPNSVPLGSPDVTLTATGAGFAPGARLVLMTDISAFGMTGGLAFDCPSTYINATTIRCTAPSVAFSHTYSIRVVAQNPSGTSSGAAALSVGGAVTIASLSPRELVAGAPGATLTVNGAGFAPGAVVRWLNFYPGSPVETLKTFFVSSTQLQATVTADQIAQGATASIRVDNPDGNVSNVLSIFVNAPVADVTSITPDTVVAGAPGFTLTINGTGFIPNAQVVFGFWTLPSTYVSAMKLTVSVPASVIFYPGKIAVSVLNISNGRASNSVDFTITPWIPTVAAVVNAASSLPSIAPGSLISIYGFDFAYLTYTWGLPPNLYPPDVLSATINGKPIPILYFGQNQINAQVPFETEPGTAVLVVTVDGVKSVPVSFQVSPTAPGVFMLPQSNHAIAQNYGDSTLNSTEHPAKPGDYIDAYLTGQGAVDNPVATGAKALPNPLSRPLAAVQAKIGGRPAEISFAGLAPGFIGLLQLNLVIPDVAGGELPFEVSIGGVSANATVISVKGN